LDDTLARRVVGKIRRETLCAHTRLSNHCRLLLQKLSRARYQAHMHTLTSKPLRNRKANPLGATSDERGAPGKLQIHSYPSLGRMPIFPSLGLCSVVLNIDESPAAVPLHCGGFTASASRLPERCATGRRRGIPRPIWQDFVPR
jgi:hypothetical protein